MDEQQALKEIAKDNLIKAKDLAERTEDIEFIDNAISQIEDNDCRISKNQVDATARLVDDATISLESIRDDLNASLAFYVKHVRSWLRWFNPKGRLSKVDYLVYKKMNKRKR